MTSVQNGSQPSDAIHPPTFTRHGHDTFTPSANISARYTVVSAKIASLPLPANAMFADSTPRKNLPSSVPARSQTYTPARRQRSRATSASTRQKCEGGPGEEGEEGDETYVHAIAACGVYVPERVDLEAVRHAGVDVCEDAAVEKRI